MLPDKVIVAVPLVGLPQTVGVVVPVPVSCAGAFTVKPIKLDAQPAADVATTVCDPAARPVIVNGLLLYATDGLPSNEYVPDVLADKLMLAVPSVAPKQLTSVAVAEPVKAAGWLILPLVTAVQPLASVTV